MKKDNNKYVLSLMAMVLGSFGSNLSLAIESKTDYRIEYQYQKPYDELTQAEHTQAKRTAETATIRPLVACADPGNMPMSNIKAEGYDNRIIKLLAEAMGTSVSFFWRPYLERGLHRETFSNKECDLLLGMPFEYAEILTTMPIYRSTYVFASKKTRDLTIEGLDDPILRDLKIGTYQHSGLREALNYHGITANVDVHVIRQDTDLTPEHQQWRQVQDVVDGKLDIAGVWGPFAGYVNAKKGGDLVIQPANLMEDRTPLEFSLAIGMRKNDVILKYALDHAIKKNAQEIEQILNEFGVPLVSCSDCAIQGQLASHGSYYERFINEAKARYTETLPEDQIQLDRETATADQYVDEKRLEKWLVDGADLNVELANAALASDKARINWLIKNGADINFINPQGYGLLHEAARYRDADMVETLLALGANQNIQDINGWTPLMHAAYSNHVPSINHLLDANADLELREAKGFTALGLALGEKKFWAAKTLITAGADVNAKEGEKAMSPLMIICLHHKADKRDRNLIEGAEPVDIAKLLIEKGAKIEGRTTLGETPLMFAAARNNSPLIGLLAQNGADLQAKSNEGKTALDIAKEHGHDGAIKSLELFARFNQKKTANKS